MRAATTFFALVTVYCGWQTGQVLPTAGGAMGLCYALGRMAAAYRAAQAASGRLATAPVAAVAVPRPRKNVDPGDTQGLIEQMLAQGRYALLLRPQLAGNLSEAAFQRAVRALAEQMALVPDGEVFLGRAPDEEPPDRDDAAHPPGRVVRVQRFFLDRYPVTNRQYYEFVAAGGYEQVSLWDEAIWPAVLDFVDAAGNPGPRFWQNGCYPPGEEEHPVAGVSWHEAAACARWLGKRLPTDAEWVKAGSWPVECGSATHAQRKYPWGDAMDLSRANLWGSGRGRTVPVTDFAGGVSVGGVYQLIGNVWEWTSGNFRPSDHPAGELSLSAPLRSIRGGAFDTYLDNQATCQFQSGEDPLQRRHNIGFRCAVGLCDLQLARLKPADEAAPAPGDAAPAAAEAVAPPAPEEVCT